ncbi:cytochrome C [Elizabethkingia meningoseptica]|uniref:c-type cytochrome n=1 Tax=Elizabethkingia meningoseptica TaxID=238 RepID=UPI000937867C|nr:c-type cytochrome [Elizabethkingia meningoseptica]MDE5487265.1 c-type cytochrome [Elizabethkingia meningoseptica]MDE5492215.1 c-type cytochrome [Elizabethkingia meningoseptica]MVW93737.1 c-type cytochrome [Elizabethkingia meningoseptica]OPC35472.1 cytochrome C [Elizabethkingia meningoseptica]
MKKQTFFIVLLAFAAFSCSKKETPVEKESNTMLEEPKVNVEEQNVSVKVPTPESGLEFINASDCRTCHSDDTKLIGPAYKDVAAKYENTEANRKMLAEKIIKGGQGVWGDIPMAPHADLSREQAEAMAMYVLSLKK